MKIEFFVLPTGHQNCLDKSLGGYILHMSYFCNKTRTVCETCCRIPIQHELFIFIIFVEKYRHFLFACILRKETVYNIDKEAKGQQHFVSSPLAVECKVGNLQ